LENKTTGPHRTSIERSVGITRRWVGSFDICIQERDIVLKIG